MFLMAVGGLVLALSTHAKRRAHDFPRGENREVLLQAPGDWPGLGYLPGDTNLVAGVQVAGMLEERLGKELFAVPRPAPLDFLFETVDQWTHIKPANIEHVIFGAEVSDRLPKLVFVVRTVNRYDAAALAKSLGSKSLAYRDRAVIRLPMKMGSGLLLCPDERTLVGLVRLEPVELKDLDVIPLPPRNGAEGLTVSLRQLLGKRLNKQSLAWFAGDLEKAAALRDMLAFTKLQTSEVELLTSLKQLTIGLYPQDSWTMDGNFSTADLKSGSLLAAKLKALKLPHVNKLTVTEPAPAVDAEPQAFWVQMQIRAAPEGLRELLGVTKLPLAE